MSEEQKRGPYLRLVAGVQWPESSDLKDQSCSSLNPLALFGCASGDDGLSLGAYGGFDQSPVLDAAVGYRWVSWLRKEALLNWLPQLSLLSASNFLGQGSNQPVNASGNALAGFGVVDVDGPEMPLCVLTSELVWVLSVPPLGRSPIAFQRFPVMQSR